MEVLYSRQCHKNAGSICFVQDRLCQSCILHLFLDTPVSATKYKTDRQCLYYRHRRLQNLQEVHNKVLKSNGLKNFIVLSYLAKHFKIFPLSRIKVLWFTYKFTCTPKGHVKATRQNKQKQKTKERKWRITVDTTANWADLIFKSTF